MKKYILGFLLFFNVISAKSQLSDSLQFSLLTVSPGTELYSIFGHTAIRLMDFKNGYDYVFNYGTFDFRTPNFYMKFALGLLDYQLAIEYFQDFKASCAFENRSVIEQILNFNCVQKQRMAYLLMENYRPENRSYRYKFFTDNCSTRPRDIISQTLETSEPLEETKIEENKTFRQLFTSYLPTMPWSQFGIELVLGKMTDNIAGYDALFLPDNLKKAVDNAKFNDAPLEKSEQLILPNKPENAVIFWFRPYMLGVLIVLLSLLIQLKRNWARWFDNVFFFLFGLLGLFITTMSFASHHDELHANFVILFFIPFIILVPFLKKEKRLRISLISFIIIVLSFVSIPFLPQHFNPSVLLLSVGVAIRCFFNFAQISNFKISMLKP